MTKRKIESGFTLIELLVVIAIIAVLVVIVIVVVNPAQRLKETRDRSFEYDVRGAGTSISVCITDKIEKSTVSRAVIFSDNNTNGCANPSVVKTYGTFATDVNLTYFNTGGQYKICAHKVSPNDGSIVSWDSKTGFLKKAGSGVADECNSY